MGSEGHVDKVDIAEEYKYLGIHRDNKMDWTKNFAVVWWPDKPWLDHLVERILSSRPKIHKNYRLCQ